MISIYYNYYLHYYYYYYYYLHYYYYYLLYYYYYYYYLHYYYYYLHCYYYYLHYYYYYLHYYYFQVTYINGSPQNTFVPGVIELAENRSVFIAGDDFKSGQTKLKSVLVDFLVAAGIKPRSLVSYNHLGNNDGKNLNTPQTFRSKEVREREKKKECESVCEKMCVCVC